MKKKWKSNTIIIKEKKYIIVIFFRYLIIIEYQHQFKKTLGNAYLGVKYKHFNDLHIS